MHPTTFTWRPYIFYATFPSQLEDKHRVGGGGGRWRCQACNLTCETTIFGADMPAQFKGEEWNGCERHSPRRQRRPRGSSHNFWLSATRAVLNPVRAVGVVKQMSLCISTHAAPCSAEANVSLRPEYSSGVLSWLIRELIEWVIIIFLYYYYFSAKLFYLCFHQGSI